MDIRAGEASKCVGNHPTRAVEMTPFACENGNLFGCVSKTSCCEYLAIVKDTRSVRRSEKMTQLSQAPLTALFLVVSLSILYRKHFVCSCFNMLVYISATGLRSTLNLMLRRPKGKQNGCFSLSGCRICVSN